MPIIEPRLAGLLPDDSTKSSFRVIDKGNIERKIFDTNGEVYNTDGTTLSAHVGSAGNPHNVVASQVGVTDSGSYFAGANVETAMQEVGAQLAAVPGGIKSSYSRTDTQTKRQIIEPPVFVKYASNPIFERSDSAWLTSNDWKLFWPWVIEVESILGVAALDKFYMYYSSDHSPSDGGIGLATAPHPTGPWTDHGRIYYDAVTGNQTETPSVVYNEKTSLFHMYYHNDSVGREQSTVLATSADGKTGWTRVGIVIDVPEYEYPGDGHTGYARVYRFGDLWIANHLMGGGNNAHFGISYSKDGLTWQTDPRPIAGMVDVTEDGTERRVEFCNGSPFMYKGQLWATWVTSPYVSGVANQEKIIYVAPYKSPRLPSPLHLAVEPSAGMWDELTTQWPFVLEYDGKLYMYYEAPNTDSKGAFGLAICDLGVMV